MAILISTPSNETLVGGIDDDTVKYTKATASVQVNLELGTSIGHGDDTLVDIESVEGGAFDDLIIGDANRNTFSGGSGNDTLIGGGGMDTLSGDDGNDIISGGLDNDLLNGGDGNDSLDGGAGSDTAQYINATNAVTVNLGLGTATGVGNDTLLNIENISGGGYNDTLIGDVKDNTLAGGAGDDILIGNASNDILRGEDGNDTLAGGDGNDSLDGGAGDDILDGGTGTDTVQYVDAANAVSVHLGQGNGTGIGSDTLFNIENIIGSAFDDTLTGDGKNNLITGGAGNDTMDGGLGIDTVRFAGNWSEYTLTAVGANWRISSNSEGQDSMTNVERLEFSDKKIALDVGAFQNMGMALEFIGVLAPTLIRDPAVIGMIGGYFDEGFSLREVSQLAIDVGLVTSIAGSNTDTALAAMAFRNVIGSEADGATLDALLSYMDGRNANYSQAEFIAVVAGLEVNQLQVGLVGLHQTGVIFI